METIKNSALKARLFLETRRYKHQRRTKNYQDAHEVGILFSAEQSGDIKALKAFVKELKKDGKHVEVLVLNNDFSDVQAEEIPEIEFKFFSLKDINFLGQIRKEEIKAFTEKKYDYLCCISATHHLIFEHILTITEACCRIGNYFMPTQNIFELTVDASKNAELSKTFKDILYYWRSISRNPSV